MAQGPTYFPFRLPPLSLLTLALIAGLTIVAAVVLVAHSRPWLGLRLAATQDGEVVVRASRGPARDIPPGTVVSEVAGGGDRVALEALDLTVEPDGAIPDYATYRRFIERQQRLAAIQDAGEMTLTDSTGRPHSLVPDRRGRPLWTLPPDFWVGLVVGFTAWLVSAAVFAFRPRDAGARYLLLSGAATLVFAPASMMYASRELAMDGTLFRWASDLNFFGGSLFTASFVALLLHYPRRLATTWVGLAVVGLFVVWFVLQQLEVFESMIFARRFLVMIGVAATFILAGVHWFGTRRDPLARAALQWFLLSWVLGTGLFALFILLPQTFGIDTSPLQGYAFLLFLLVYGGLAFGILRFRLFELGQWWRRVIGWMAAVLALVGLDLFFLYGLRLSSGTSLALALLICGVVWLPFRFWLWQRLAGRRESRIRTHFGRVMAVALTPPENDGRDRGWRELVREIFEPLEIEPGEASAVAIGRSGLVLDIPPVGEIGALRLAYPRHGHALFRPDDAELAAELVSMLAHGIESLASYEKGVAEERSRIARDMHDNLGSQLLAALHSPDPSAKNARIREALADLREMINQPSNDRAATGDILAELRVETANRLEASGMSLRWSDAPTPPGIDRLTGHALRSIIREAVSNAILHSGASTVEVSIDSLDGSTRLHIADDGRGFDPARTGDGRGLANIRSRIDLLHGSFEIASGTAGTRLTACIPVEIQAP